MKVWVVEAHSYESSGIRGIFTTEAAALAFVPFPLTHFAATQSEPEHWAGAVPEELWAAGRPLTPVEQLFDTVGHVTVTAWPVAP